MAAQFQFDLLTIEDRITVLLEENRFTDVSFALGEEPEIFHAHKAILSVASPVFEKMFYGSLAEKTDRIIKLCDTAPRVFAQMLKYIYTDTESLQYCEDAFELYNVAQKYMLNQLEKTCIKYLERELTPSNALRIDKFAKLFDEQGLEQKVLTLIREQTILVINSVGFADEIDISTLKIILDQDELQTTEMELFQALESLAVSEGLMKQSTNANAGNCNHLSDEEENVLKKQFREAVKKIQFYSMTTEQFTNGPALSKLLLSEEAVAITACIQMPSKLKTLYPKDFVQDVRKPKKLPHVFFDMSVDGESIGRIVIQLRSDVVPETVEYFLPYCTGQKAYGFKGSKFNIKDSFTCQIKTVPNNLGFEIEKENSVLSMKEAGCVGLLCRKNKIICNSFFITLGAIEDIHVHIIIGLVVQGMDVVAAIKSYGTDNGGPSKKVLIKNCGKLSNKAIL